ncbi:MAG: secondary thiamine-phosphate synthase enzyme YjbQ [Gammaproteobacteria bacterium]|nr:secondary thiamine-phosphate synthase enzyme YjbQ [Gammaproteobacteria bacterium]
MIRQEKISIRTGGRGTTDVTGEIQAMVQKTGVQTGLCHVFLHHTSASLMLCENADPSVRRDLETFMTQLAPDGDPMFEHTAEGPDDMPAHVRSVLTSNHLSIPVSNGRCALGTWQGIYLWEHRHQSHTRSLTVSIQD